MQNGAQTNASGRLLGFVRVLVGGQVFDLPVQGIPFDKDGDRGAGGFFVHQGQLGILVDETKTAPEMQAQIEEGTVEAVRHLSKKFLN